MKEKICCGLFTLIAICIVYISTFDVVKTETISNDIAVKFVDSEVLTEEVQIEQVIEEEQTEETQEVTSVIKQEEEQDLKDSVLEVKKEDIKPEKEVQEVIPVVETLTGKMSGYGPDCVGCSGYLANGMYVGDGTIYYNDKEYGKVRIVAGDKKYKFGTIVEINDSMLAIVLDRGGAIGIGKKCLFDLLYASEQEANKNGVLNNAKFEILRNGF